MSQIKRRVHKTNNITLSWGGGGEEGEAQRDGEGQGKRVSIDYMH